MKSSLMTSPSLLEVIPPTFIGKPTRHIIILHLQGLFIPRPPLIITPCWVEPVLMYMGHLMGMACPGSMNLVEPCSWHIPIPVRFLMGCQIMKLIRLLPPFCRCSNPSIPYECVERHPINPHPRHFLRSPSLRRLPTTVMEQFYQMREIKKQMASASHLSFWQKLCTLVGEIATVYHTQIVIVRPGSRLPNTVRLLNFMTVLNDTNFRMLITNTFHQEEACCIWFLSSNPAF